MGANLLQVRPAAAGAHVVEFRGVTPTDLRKLARRLADGAEVEYLVEDAIFQPAFIPNDPGYSQQWALHPTPQGIGANNAWARFQTGADTIVAVLDTGYLEHPDILANHVKGYDFISDASSAGDGSGRDASPIDEGSGYVAGCGARKSSWHGTNIAGIIAAVGNNQTGIIGAAFGAKFMPVRVLGKQGGVRSDIVDAITWAAGGQVPGVPVNANPVEVINLSLRVVGVSGFVCEEPERAAIQFAIDSGVVVVAAAGNDNQPASMVSPASCPGVIAVGASDQFGYKASFSNYGPTITLLAPGVDIYTTSDIGVFVRSSYSYATASGTSMAAPFVSAAAAMVQSIAPRTPQQVKELLMETAKPLSAACQQGCGAGILDIDAATAAAAGPRPIAAFIPALVAQPNCPDSNLVSYEMNNISFDGNNNIVAHQWYRSGMPFSTESSPLVTKVSGPTSIRLVVTDATGLTDEKSTTLGGFRCVL
jgi:serine protease